MAHNPQEDFNQAAVKAASKESKAARPLPTKQERDLAFLMRLELRLNQNITALRNSNSILHAISLSVLAPRQSDPTDKMAAIHARSRMAAIVKTENMEPDGSFVASGGAAPDEALPKDLEISAWLAAPKFSESLAANAIAKIRHFSQGEDALFSQAWANLCASICDADVALRRSRQIPLASYSIADELRRSPNSPLKDMSPADMAIFEKARRKANALRPPISRSELYESLADFIRSNIQQACDAKKLTFAHILVEENSASAIEITSLHVIGQKGTTRITNTGAHLKIVVDPFPLEAKGLAGISKMIQKRRLFSLGQEELFSREWRRAASLLAQADSKARIFFDCPTPAGLAAIVEHSELSQDASPPRSDQSSPPAKRRRSL